ncbi:MAG: hypothetical protein PV362_06270, partial [Providencia heimbachae]|nr:hypothetical protein [Providencia heimbachae]
FGYDLLYILSVADVESYCIKKVILKNTLIFGIFAQINLIRYHHFFASKNFFLKDLNYKLY